MEELKRIYDELFSDLKDLHENWVASNWKLRALEQAENQLHSVGDIDISPVLELVRSEYEKELKTNRSLNAKQITQKAILEKIRRSSSIGSLLKDTSSIFGW